MDGAFPDWLILTYFDFPIRIFETKMCPESSILLFSNFPYKNPRFLRLD